MKIKNLLLIIFLGLLITSISLSSAVTNKERIENNKLLENSSGIQKIPKTLPLSIKGIPYEVILAFVLVFIALIYILFRLFNLGGERI